MIRNGEGWYYLAVKVLSTLSRRMTSKCDGKFYCLICLYSFRPKNLESHKKIFNNKDFCNLEVPSEDNKIIEFNQ